MKRIEEPARQIPVMAETDVPVVEHVGEGVGLRLDPELALALRTRRDAIDRREVGSTYPDLWPTGHLTQDPAPLGNRQVAVDRLIQATVDRNQILSIQLTCHIALRLG